MIAVRISLFIYEFVKVIIKLSYICTCNEEKINYVYNILNILYIDQYLPRVNIDI